MILALVGLAIALESGDEVRVELRGGGELSGYALTASETALELSNAQGHVEVPTALVSRAWVEGVELDPSRYRQDVEAFHAAQLAARSAEGLRTPPVLVVGAASAIWPGTGHLLLGQPREFLAYSAVELALLGIGAYWVLGPQLLGPLIPLAFLDIGFRAYAVAETTREARKRRAFVSLAPRPAGGAVIQIAWGGAVSSPYLTGMAPIH